MGTPEDSSPLWGTGQFSYPDFSRPSAVSTWPENSPPATAFDPYGARDTMDYAELKPDSFLHYHQQHQMSAPPVPHGGFLPSLIQHPPFLNGHNVLLPESSPYLSPMLAVQNQHMSPDGGYSSPGSAGSEYFGLPYHGQQQQQHQQPQTVPQEYMASMSPYGNMVPSVEAEAASMDQQIKQESQQEAQPVFPHQLEYIVQTVDESKPIIHENIMICPPMQMQHINQQTEVEPIQFHVSTPVVHQPRPQATATADITHDEVDRLIYRSRYVGAQAESQPSVPAPSEHRIVARVDLDSPNSSEASDDLAPTSPNPDPSTLLDPQNRRSARPSVIEHSNFECDQCGNFFARQCGLTQHKKWIHSPRMIPCEKCGKKFLTPDELAKHIVKHTQQDKPHKCPVCPKQFCHKNDLRRHMFRHSEKVPFMCGICHRGFIRADHLTAHEISHERRRKISSKQGAGGKKADDGGKKQKKK
uniref:Putative c2h2-type zn-finger protein n=1 Tax=Culex tarsalis TaxID=7177 RepID=A0A1Q3EV61_CULTA